MADTASAPPEGAQPDPAIDWEAAEESPEFQELVAQAAPLRDPGDDLLPGLVLRLHRPGRLREDFMGESVYEGLTVGYVLALTQFVMVWGLGWLYLRKADRDFDPLRERAARRRCRWPTSRPRGDASRRRATGPARPRRPSLR